MKITHGLTIAMNSIPLWPPQNRTVGRDNAMTNAISQNVLEEILKAYPHGSSRQALRQWLKAPEQ